MLRLLACTLMLMAASSLHAQEVKLHAPKFALLLNDSVIKELKLTADQQNKIKEALGDCLQEVDGQKRIVVAGHVDMEAMEADCVKSLNDKQVKRLRQAWLQNNGAMAVLEDQLAKDLKLTPDQRKKAGDTVQKMNEELRELFQPGVDLKEQLPKLKEIRTTARKSIEASLTKDQLAKLTELQGSKIDGLNTP